MAMSAFLNINGYDMPPARYGFEYIISTAVDAGRNVSGAVVGQKIGRDLFKFNNLQFVWLTPETRMMILAALEPFYVPVTFENVKTGRPITIHMYPGDRTGKPYYVDKLTHMITRDETLSFNLIDCMWERNI